MLIGYHRGQGSIVLRVKILNSSVTTGAGLTGLLFSSAGLIISTIVDNEATATAYTAAGSTTETITTLGTYAAPTATKCRFKEVDATNHKGIYEVQIADARFAVASGKSVLVSISGATNAAETDVVIPLTDIDPYDAVRAGLTAFPNVASGSAGALLVDGTGTAAISNSSGKVLLQATQAGVTIPTVTTVTNQLTAAAIATGVWTDTTAGDFTTALSVGKSVMNGVSLGTGLTVAAVSGAVGSVTGAVGSVTGLTAATVHSDLDDIQARLPAALTGAGNMKVDALALNGSTTAADNLKAGALGLVSSTCAVGSTTTSIVTNLTEATDDHYNGRVITFTSGALAGQTSSISDYVGATKTLTVVALTEAPANTDGFVIS